jgi:glycosyltransferase involved in cell wall biosynthesis
MLPSQEAFGKTVIESMACGTPVCVLDGSGPREIVELVGGGVIVQDDPFDVAFDEAKKPNINLIQQRFSNRSIAKKYLDLYQRLR